MKLSTLCRALYFQVLVEVVAAEPDVSCAKTGEAPDEGRLADARLAANGPLTARAARTHGGLHEP